MHPDRRPTRTASAPEPCHQSIGAPCKWSARKIIVTAATLWSMSTEARWSDGRFGSLRSASDPMRPSSVSGTMATMSGQAFQDMMVDNYCWGCGADNPVGLQLKSHWDGDVAVAQWQPTAEYAAGPRHILNGGIIATLLDCHGVCTAVATAYASQDRAIGSEPEIWHATVSLTIDYLRPTPINEAVQLSARVAICENSGTSVECVLGAGGKDRARATVRTTRVPDAWRHGSKG